MAHAYDEAQAEKVAQMVQAECDKCRDKCREEGEKVEVLSWRAFAMRAACHHAMAVVLGRAA